MTLGFISYKRIAFAAFVAAFIRITKSFV